MTNQLEEIIEFHHAMSRELRSKLTVSKNEGRSLYWTEESEQFDYLFTATTEVLAKIRHHCHLITGIRAYEYGRHHARGSAQDNLEKRLNRLIEVDPSLPVLAERPELGGFGFEIEGQLFNIDTLKFHEMHLALKRFAGMNHQVNLDFANPTAAKNTVVEVGAGWGGFAETFLRRFPNTRYVIIDLPEVLLVSGTLLKAWFPKKSIALFGSENRVLGLDNADVLLVCNSDLHALPKSLAPTFLVNSVSFQEMTTTQVREYVGWARSRECDFIYSLNRDRSNYNSEITSVREILAEHLNLKEIEILDRDYTSALKPEKKKKDATINRKSENRYRHVFAY